MGELPQDVINDVTEFMQSDRHKELKIFIDPARKDVYYDFVEQLRELLSRFFSSHKNVFIATSIHRSVQPYSCVSLIRHAPRN